MAGALGIGNSSALTETATGDVSLGNGTIGNTSGIFRASLVVLIPRSFGSLPAASTVPGAIACVNTSSVTTWGSNIVGSGTSTVLAFSDGTNWTVAGI